MFVARISQLFNFLDFRLRFAGDVCEILSEHKLSAARAWRESESGFKWLNDKVRGEICNSARINSYFKQHCVGGTHRRTICDVETLNCHFLLRSKRFYRRGSSWVRCLRYSRFLNAHCLLDNFLEFRCLQIGCFSFASIRFTLFSTSTIPFLSKNNVLQNFAADLRAENRCEILLLTRRAKHIEWPKKVNV